MNHRLDPHRTSRCLAPGPTAARYTTHIDITRIKGIPGNETQSLNVGRTDPVTMHLSTVDATTRAFQFGPKSFDSIRFDYRYRIDFFRFDSPI